MPVKWRYITLCFPKHALSVSIAGPEGGDDGRGPRLTVSVMNAGNRSLRLVNAPHCVLSAEHAHKFDFVHVETRARARFIGHSSKRSVEDLARSTDAKDFTVLAPGQYITLKRNLCKDYDFSASGPGTYVVDPRLEFYALRPDGSILDLDAELVQTCTVLIHPKEKPSSSSSSSTSSASSH